MSGERKPAGKFWSANKLWIILPVFFLAAAILHVTGCRRHNQDDFDDRTLEKKTHVETDKFPDKSDPFRP
jgi:hypothetical protein